MIGRKKEIDELMDLYQNNEAELVVIYGRRRVGKTYFVNQCLKEKFAFRHAGLSPIEDENETNYDRPLKRQLKHFYKSLQDYGLSDNNTMPEDWLDAFYLLIQLLKSKDTNNRMVVFLDELPWLDTPKSGFITAFEGFWNNWGCHNDNLLLIVCGSSTSWVMDKLINNHGGLYDRVTYEIKMSPFTLAECEEYLKERKVKLSRYDIVCAYMIVGGIPYYLRYFKRGYSLSQNIDHLFFSQTKKLRDEFSRMFHSIFAKPKMMMDIVKALSERNSGLTRAEITEKTHYSGGGTLTKALKSLIAGDFIIKYYPYGHGKKTAYYKLIDPFCMFYIKFVEGRDSLDQYFWIQNQTSQSIVSWRGFAFENVCFNHIEKIKSALGISGINTKHSTWSKREDDEAGTQIDMIIERDDNVVNLCEMKFYSNDFAITKDYHRVLINRRSLLENKLPKKKIVHNTLITTYGLKYNEYSSFFDNVITLDALFE